MPRPKDRGRKLISSSFIWSGLAALLITPMLLREAANASQLDDAVAAYEAKHYPEAITLLMPLAKAGDAEAQFLMGRMTDKGLGTQLNHRKAADWYKRAAEHGHVRSLIAMGDLLSDDSIIFHDYEAAMEYYRQAADKGSADGAFKVSAMYGSGKGVPTNETEAFRWAALAAERGSMEGIESIGLSYSTGRGTTKDSFEAYVWLQTAALRCWSSGRLECARTNIWLRDMIGMELTADQVAGAQAVAEQRLKTIPIQ